MTNEHKPCLLKASDIQAMDGFEFHHPLNPNSEIHLRFLGRTFGFQRIGVTIELKKGARNISLPPSLLSLPKTQFLSKK